MEDPLRPPLALEERIALVEPRVARIEALSGKKKRKVLGEYGWPDYKELQQQRASGEISEEKYWEDMSDVLHNNGIEFVEVIDERANRTSD